MANNKLPCSFPGVDGRALRQPVIPVTAMVANVNSSRKITRSASLRRNMASAQHKSGNGSRVWVMIVKNFEEAAKQLRAQHLRLSLPVRLDLGGCCLK